MALPVIPPLNVRSPLGRLMKAMFIASRRTSKPNLSECWPLIQVRSSAICHTWLTRCTKGCCGSPSADTPPPKKPCTEIDGRPAASGLVLAKPMP